MSKKYIHNNKEMNAKAILLSLLLFVLALCFMTDAWFTRQYINMKQTDTAPDMIRMQTNVSTFWGVSVPMIIGISLILIVIIVLLVSFKK